MANLVVKRGDIFPGGTKVKVFTVAKPEIAELSRQSGSPATWHPALVELEEDTVASDGTLTIAGAVSGVGYICWALVNAKDVYLRVEGT